MDDELQPLPYDPAAAEIVEMFDLGAENWYYSAPGDYQVAAVQAMKNDGTNFQTLLALEWPVRNRNTNEESTLRLLIHPDDAVGLASVLQHTTKWLASARLIGN